MEQSPYLPSPLDRRQLLSTAAIATAAAAATSFQCSAAEKKRIPIGFLGATYSHGADKIKLAMNSPDWQFVGVCDDSAAGRAICEKLGAKRIEPDELLKRAEVVAVESDIRSHAADALLVLQAGKHVHLEKPPATTLEEVKSLFSVARKKKLLLQTGFMWRYNPGFLTIYEAVRKGWLGDVVLVRGHVSNNLDAARRMQWAEFAGGSMFELGSHLLDAAVRLLGKPKQVTPFVRHHGSFSDSLRDNNVAVLEYEHAMAVITNTALQSTATPPRSFEVVGTKGTATMGPIEPPMLTLDLTLGAGPYQQGTQTVSLPEYRRYEADFAELAAAVRGERPLSVSLDEEELVARTVLQASGMAGD